MRKKLLVSPLLSIISALLLISSCSKSEHPLPTDQSSTSQEVLSSSAKKNVLFILVDDLGYSDIGAYNANSFYDTPNIDKLAAQGLQFTQGYAANPVCSPSRFAILTGKHPTRDQATDWFPINDKPARSGHFNPAQFKDFLPLSEITLAEAFQTQGYATAFLGKWHLGADQSLWPEHHGFDINIAGTKNGHPPGGYFSPYKNPRLADGPEGEYLTERLTNEAINLVDGYSKQEQPFFMFLSFYTVHTPLQAPEQDIEKYNNKRLKSDIDDSFMPEEQVWPVPDERLVRVKQNHSTYAAMVNKMDHHVGRLLDKLQATGMAENTIIVFTSDNGGLSTSEGSPTSNLPLRGGKGWLYEGGIRVPFIVKIPNVTNPGMKINEPVISMDLYPTLLSATGLKPVDKQLDGENLVAMINGKKSFSALNQRPLYFHYPHYSNQGGFPGAAIRLGDWKLIERFENGEVNLYNLREDLAEQNDLANSMPEQTKLMRGMLHDWYKETDAKFLQAKDGQSPWLP